MIVNRNGRNKTMYTEIYVVGHDTEKRFIIIQLKQCQNMKKM